MVTKVQIVGGVLLIGAVVTGCISTAMLYWAGHTGAETDGHDWFRVRQAMYNMCLIASFVCSCMSATKNARAITLTKVAIFLSLIAMVFGPLTIMLSGMKTVEDIYIYMTSSSYLTCSYYLALLSFSLDIFALICMFLSLSSMNKGQLEKQAYHLDTSNKGLMTVDGVTIIPIDNITADSESWREKDEPSLKKERKGLADYSIHYVLSSHTSAAFAAAVIEKLQGFGLQGNNVKIESSSMSDSELQKYTNDLLHSKTSKVLVQYDRYSDTNEEFHRQTLGLYLQMVQKGIKNNFIPITIGLSHRTLPSYINNIVLEFPENLTNEGSAVKFARLANALRG